MSDLPWLIKDFDVRKWQESEKQAVLRPTTRLPDDVRQVIEGNTKGVVLPESPFQPKIKVRQGHFGRQRDANKKFFVDGWLSQAGLHTKGNPSMVDIVSKRVKKRVKELGLHKYAEETPLAAYDEVLHHHPGEWLCLMKLARIHYTRFNRDRCFDYIYDTLLPQCMAQATADGRTHIAASCAGCSSGEEPHSLALHWNFGGRERAAQAALAQMPEGTPKGLPQRLELKIYATDVSPECIEKASQGQYDGRPWASFGRLPSILRAQGTRPAQNNRSTPMIEILPEIRKCITFQVQDLKREGPPESQKFDMILCRHCAFMYFDDAMQESTLRRFADVLLPGGFLAIGSEDRPLEELHTGRTMFKRVDLSNHQFYVRC